MIKKAVIESVRLNFFAVLVKLKLGNDLPPSDVTTSLHWHSFPFSLPSFTTSVHFVGVRVSSFSPFGSSSLLVTLPITLHFVGVRGRCSFWICLERCSCCCGGTEAWIRPFTCIVLLILLLCCGLDLRPLCACLVLSILLVWPPCTCLVLSLRMLLLCVASCLSCPLPAPRLAWEDGDWNQIKKSMEPTIFLGGGMGGQGWVVWIILF